MKTLIALLCLISLTATAQTNTLTARISFQWDANAPGESVTNYTLYWWSSGSAITNAIPTGTNLTTTITNLSSGSYGAFVTAQALGAESFPSTTLLFPVPYRPSSPSNLTNSLIIEMDFRFKFKSP